MSEIKHYPSIGAEEPIEPVDFVNLGRIKEVERLPKDKYDAIKLGQLLVELNRAYAAHSFFSCQFLVRAIADHVPPIFGMKTFSEVANNYAGGGKSFRESMQHLDSSCRKLADGSLHSQIRSRESLPTQQQVEFRPDVDALIGEVVRVLRKVP